LASSTGCTLDLGDDRCPFRDAQRVERRVGVNGCPSMLLAHEAGHMGVAAAMGIDADIDDFTVVYPGENLTSRQQLRVASAGLQSQ